MCVGPRSRRVYEVARYPRQLPPGGARAIHHGNRGTEPAAFSSDRVCFDMKGSKCLFPAETGHSPSGPILDLHLPITPNYQSQGRIRKNDLVQSIAQALRLRLRIHCGSLRMTVAAMQIADTKA